MKNIAPALVALLLASATLPLHAASEADNKYGMNLLFVGVTYHPDGGENEGYPRKLDDAAYWVLLLGAEADFDLYLHRFALLRGTVTLNKDCADLWSGFFHLGPRLNLPVGSRFVFRVGIGPTLIWRQNWYGKVAGYTKDSFYGKATNGTFQSRYIWYGGNLDFEWKIKPNISLIYSNIPGWPEIITSSVGARYSY